MQPLDLYNPTEQHAMLRETVRQFVVKEVEPQALGHDRAEKFNLPLFRKLGSLGLLGITVPEQWGGAGMDATAAVIVHEELSAADPGFCLSYLAHSMLFVNNCTTNSSDAQRARFLPDVLSGDKIAGMGMSEPGAGTDVLGMKSAARKVGDHYVLNGRKMWITNGCISDTELGDIFLIYAKTEGGRLSTFVVEKGMKGFSLGQRIKDKTGMRASPTAELVFDDCEVPEENRLGDEGSSLEHMMRNLEIERLTLAAMSLGIARRCLKVMNQYAQERQSFGQPINRYGQIQNHIATSYAQYMAGRAYVYDTARRTRLDRYGMRTDTDGVKLFCSTMGKVVADSAMQVLGGYGYVGEYVVERLWRDAKLLEIGGGTIEAHQKNITRDLARYPQALD
ncbi:MAG: acyl-CoA dehydrogenase family protein [Myxococcales bacterium]|nr:acyl-CoA dehydrogenase family protein [Myxococcales bacterium]